MEGGGGVELRETAERRELCLICYCQDVAESPSFNINNAGNTMSAGRSCQNSPKKQERRPAYIQIYTHICKILQNNNRSESNDGISASEIIIRYKNISKNKSKIKTKGSSEASRGRQTIIILESTDTKRGARSSALWPASEAPSGLREVR